MNANFSFSLTTRHLSGQEWPSGRNPQVLKLGGVLVT